jgi:ferric-dicitrate binding protein FerR (iron transport regulator)
MQKEELLRKYLAGLSTPTEEKELYRLLLQDDTSEQYRQVSYDLWQKFGDEADLPPDQREKMYAGIAAATGIKPGRRIAVWRYAAAASVILLLSATLFFLYFGNSTVHLSTAYAEKQEVELPDGSTILLNANSELRYHQDWEKNGVREVWLEGEAYFKVSKLQNSEDKPVKFVVHAQDLEIQVLGTEFNVQNLGREVQVVLAEGKVRLSNQATDLKLDMKPGQLVAYSAEKQQVIREEVNTRQYTAWKDGRYIFDDLSLQEIAHLINRNYGKEVVFEQPALADKRMSATIPSTDLEVVIAIIEETMGVMISTSEDTITISSSQP